jgi:hypothetical protein
LVHQQLTDLPGRRLLCGAAKAGEIPKLFFDRANCFDPKPYELDPNPYTR